MKIKVVDMTYEQALAQPPQVHKKPKKPSLLFRTILRAASAPDLLATHFHCEKIGMAQIKSDEPCLVLMNHSCFLDLKIAEAVLYPRPFNIVCTSDGFVGKEWLMRSVGCIPTRKFCSDTTLVRDMLYAVKKLKSSILLYPEASYSFDGTATPLPESLGKCVKALGVPIVLLRTCGAFARDPLYNGLQNRRVNVSAELRYLLSPEEAAEGFEVLFDGTSMHKWTGNTTNYVPLDGTIYVTAQYGGSGNLYTKKEYADFILRFEFQFVQEGVNNGIGIRTPMGVDAAYHGMEIQILDHDAPIYKNLREYQQHGSVYGIIPAKRVKFPSLGTWNVEEIRAVGDRITVTVNGEVILDGDIREACQGHNVAPDGGKKNPYTVDHRNHPGLFNASGHIGLLGHGPGIKFRNIRIKELPCSKVRDLPAPVKTK